MTAKIFIEYRNSVSINILLNKFIAALICRNRGDALNNISYSCSMLRSRFQLGMKLSLIFPPNY